jgi:hypothetical protein
MMEIKELLKAKTEEHQKLVDQLRAMENQRAVVIQEILRFEGELRVLRELSDGAKPAGGN